jgi:hypothetical protein
MTPSMRREANANECNQREFQRLAMMPFAPFCRAWPGAIRSCSSPAFLAADAVKNARVAGLALALLDAPSKACLNLWINFPRAEGHLSIIFYRTRNTIGEGIGLRNPYRLRFLVPFDPPIRDVIH